MIYDVIIIGAGVVGGAAARELSRYELSILCLEKEEDVCCGTSKGNTGIIHTPALVPPGTLKAEMAVRGAARFDRLSRELGFGYQKTGALILAFTEEDLQVLEKYRKNAIINYEKAGFKPDEYRILRDDELLRAEPALNPEVKAALLAPDAGRIIPYEYGIALWENAVLNGAVLKPGREVGHIERSSENGGCWKITTAGGDRQYMARFIINAAGHGSGEIGTQAGFNDGSVRSVKGQYLILDREAGPSVNRILFQVPRSGQEKKGKGILVTETVYGNLMIGPDAREQYDSVDTSTDMDSLCEVVAGARRSVPGVDPVRCIKTFAGIRPRPAGGDFVIESGGNFIHLCGIESPGLTSSPAIAEEVVRRLADMGLELKPRRNFRPERKPVVDRVLDLENAEVKRRVALPSGDPQRLVCRCEQVPEARILDALRRGIPVKTLDGVKRRTRAGQGRCQGAFCGNRVRELLAGEYDLPPEKITQRGKEPETRRVTAAEVRNFYKR